MQIWDILALFIDPIFFLFRKTPKPLETLPTPLEVPSSEIGTPIPVIWGTRTIAPLTAWYGDLKIIKVKVDSGGKK